MDPQEIVTLQTKNKTKPERLVEVNLNWRFLNFCTTLTKAHALLFRRFRQLFYFTRAFVSWVHPHLSITW